MIKAHQIRLYPNKAQEILLRKSCGVARFSYNWALNKWKEMYEAGGKPTAYKLIKLQNAIKKEQFAFFLDVSKTAPQYAVHNLEKAFIKFFKGECKYPKFKKKGAKDSFVAVENWQGFKQADFRIHIPRIGKIRCAENLRFEGKVNNVVIKRVADMWFAAVNIEVPVPARILKQSLGENQAIVGVDMGIKSMMVLSDGTVFGSPKALKKNLKKLKRLQRKLSKQQKGSNNRNHQKVKVAKLFYRISCIRANAIHQSTSFIVKYYDKIVIEDLNVAGMIKNRKLSQAISDVSFGEIARQLAYKAQWQNTELIKADRFYPSSKICSHCGHKKDQLKLSERTYKCESCGIEIDRDLNAAKNLANYSPTPRLGGSKACGEGSSANESLHSPLLNQEIESFDNNLNN